MGLVWPFGILHASVVPQIPIRRLNHTASALEDDTCPPISPDDFTLAWVFVSVAEIAKQIPITIKTTANCLNLSEKTIGVQKTTITHPVTP